MELTPEVKKAVLEAESKALGSVYENVVNVVPVSSVKIKGNKIWLINYFMGKTLNNILNNPIVTLACWKGLSGYQIKARVKYVSEGGDFEEAKKWISEILPERVVRGLLMLDPIEVFDVSASKDHAGKKVL